MSETCAAAGCASLAVTTLSGDAGTLRWLGFAGQTDHFSVRVCAACYLKAMSEVLARARLPKDEPPRVEYRCATCDKVVSPMEARFVRGVSPYHDVAQPDGSMQRHVLAVQVVR